MNRTDALTALLMTVLLQPTFAGQGSPAPTGDGEGEVGEFIHHEQWEGPPPTHAMVRQVAAMSRSTIVVRNGFRSIQVNTDALGLNFLGDAANEPSIAVDPADAARLVIGWRQFDSVLSNFRQAGYAYSHDGGQTWTFPGVLDPGQFRSDPVLAADGDGNFYYYSLSALNAVELFKSIDGGVSWSIPVPGFGGDKEWMTIDRTSGVGRGNIYTVWNSQFSCCGLADFARSINGGVSFQSPLSIPTPKMKWGALDVARDGTLFLAGSTLNQAGHLISRSTNAQNKNQSPVFDFVNAVNLGGVTRGGNGSATMPNPNGLFGQVTIATDHSDGLTSGNVYILGSVDPPTADPLNVMFIRSQDGGLTWSTPVRVNDDASSTAWQWFGTMSVAPNGRIDVVWNDTRNTGVAKKSELFYSFSVDGGANWSQNVAISPVFDSHLGWPNQNKIGDYYDMVSDNSGANLAYSATFNGEQDVYFLRIGDTDCNGNGVTDAEDIATEFSDDCNGNGVPDDCERDCNSNMIADTCDVADRTSLDCDNNLVPDECGPDFDFDGVVDGCDDDRDGDGTLNSTDQCPFTPLDIQANDRGRPISDTNGDCVVSLPDLVRLVGSSPSRKCLWGPGVPLSPTCTDFYDYDVLPGEGGDGVVDLFDVAKFMIAFGRE